MAFLYIWNGYFYAFLMATFFTTLQDVRRYSHTAMGDEVARWYCRSDTEGLPAKQNTTKVNRAQSLETISWPHRW
jgi:hypothetical protein